MKKLFLIIHLIMATGVLFAGNGNNTENKKENKTVPAEAGTLMISGKITDKVTGEALTGVKVTIEGLDVKAYTDFDGNFRFEKLPSGEYDLTTTYVSYDRKQVQKVIPVRDSKNLEIPLKKSY